MKRGNKSESALFNSFDSHDRSRSFVRAALLSPLVCTILASLGIFGGISALFAGLVCVVIHALVPGETLFDEVGTTLLIVAIPAILIGAIFIDEINVKK